MNNDYINRIVQSCNANSARWSSSWMMMLGKDVSYSYASVSTAYINLVAKHNEFNDNMYSMPAGVIARAAILCLRVYEDCGYMLDSDPNELKLLCILGDEKAKLMFWACRTLKVANG